MFGSLSVTQGGNLTVQSTSSTLNTNTQQPQSQSQPLTDRIQDSPPPSESSTHTTPHNFPQQGPSTFSATPIDTQNSLQLYFQSVTSPRQVTFRTPPYNPAQNVFATLKKTCFIFNTIHSIPNATSANYRTLSRPPLPTVPTKTLG